MDTEQGVLIAMPQAARIGGRGEQKIKPINVFYISLEITSSGNEVVGSYGERVFILKASR